MDTLTLTQALRTARAAALEVRRDAPAALGFTPPAEMAWEFWRDQVDPEQDDVLAGLFGWERRRVRQHFLETYGGAA
jgi:hypothetical protein